MQLEIEVNGRTRRVTVEPAGPAGAPLRVQVDGRPYLVDARRLDGSTLSLILLDRHASHDVGLVERTGGELVVHLRTGTIRLLVNGRRSRRTAAEAAGGPGEQRIVAPMPGRVVRVLVAPGAEVALGQPLVVVEAMKMENELRAPKAGRVKEVGVTPGMSVEAGRPLVVVE